MACRPTSTLRCISIAAPADETNDSLPDSRQQAAGPSGPSWSSTTFTCGDLVTRDPPVRQPAEVVAHTLPGGHVSVAASVNHDPVVIAEPVEAVLK